MIDQQTKSDRPAVILALLGSLSIALVAATAGLSPTMAATSPTPTPPSVIVTRDVVYESANPLLTPGLLDVYTPAEAGPWPLVVMLHGGPPLRGAIQRSIDEHPVCLSWAS